MNNIFGSCETLGDDKSIDRSCGDLQSALLAINANDAKLKYSERALNERTGNDPTQTFARSIDHKINTTTSIASQAMPIRMSMRTALTVEEEERIVKIIIRTRPMSRNTRVCLP